MARKGGKGSPWFIVPTLLFTALPIACVIWSASTADVSRGHRLMGLAPFAVGFASPVLLLLPVYYELGKRAGKGCPRGRSTHEAPFWSTRLRSA